MEKRSEELKMVFWETTAQCNLHCQHCRSTSFSERLKDELNTAEIKRFVDELVEFARPLMVMTGGEPLLRPDIFEVAKYMRTKNLNVSLASNGALFNKDIVRKIKDSGIELVSISIDGKDAKTHDPFRRSPGAFAKILKGAAFLKEEGLFLHVNTTITRHNLSQIQAIVELSERLGARSMHFFLLIPTGCGKNIRIEDRISPQEAEEAVNFICAYYPVSPIPIKAVCAPFYFRILQQRNKGLDLRYTRIPNTLGIIWKGCLVGRRYVFISSSGNVYPCGYLPLSAGNLRKESLRSIWENSVLFSDLRNPEKLKGKCARCNFKLICGGCRARAYAHTKDFLAEDPQCIYEPAGKRVELDTEGNFSEDILR
jgi:heme b synthase